MSLLYENDCIIIIMFVCVKISPQFEKMDRQLSYLIGLRILKILGHGMELDSKEPTLLDK
jgi:hypothetical protein